MYQVHKLASVCGKIISLGNCVGNVVRLMTRNIFAVINSAMNWNSMVSLTPGCVDPGEGGVLPYMDYIGMCGPKGYGFSAGFCHK